MTTPAAAKLYQAQHEYAMEGKKPVVYNPNEQPLEELPEIMCFSAMANGGDGIAYALAEDGAGLGSHWCSHEGYVSHDLAVLEGCHISRHETYKEHYPNGYRMRFILSKDVKSDEKLQKAFYRNERIAEEEKRRTEGAT
jgi:hypothetical protein